MQALGSYQGSRMLFPGLGTGLGSALIMDNALEPMELAHLPYKKGRAYEDDVGLAGLELHQWVPSASLGSAPTDRSPLRKLVRSPPPPQPKLHYSNPPTV